jgi:transposase InsO family protein
LRTPHSFGDAILGGWGRLAIGPLLAYLPTLVGWVYLAVECFSRKVMGWSLGDSLATPLVAGALRRAIESRWPV